MRQPRLSKEKLTQAQGKFFLANVVVVVVVVVVVECLTGSGGCN